MKHLPSWLRTLFLLLILTACSTPGAPPTSSDFAAAPVLEMNDCAAESRGPSAVKVCRDLFRVPKSRRSTEELEAERDSVISSVESRMREIEQFSQTEPLGMWGILLGPERVREAIRRDVHPIDLLPKEEAMNFAKAWKSLRDIPDARFRMDAALALDVNKLVLGDLSTKVMQSLSPDVYRDEKKRGRLKNFYVQSIRPWLTQRGKLRSRNAKLDFASKPMSENEYRALRENAALAGVRVIEAPYSAPDGRLATLELVPKAEVGGRMENLVRWAQERSVALGSSPRDGILDFVAELHIRFAGLQPFASANDATVQLLINRILLQMRLPPAVQIPFEMTMSKQEVKDLYRDALKDYVRLTLMTGHKEVVSIMGRGTGTRLSQSDLDLFARAREIVQARDNMTPDNSREVFRLGKEEREFVIGDDGIIFDSKQIPHIIREENGQIRAYPIAHRTYTLLGLNGASNDLKGVMRDPTPEHIDYAKMNESVVERILSGQIKPNDVEVVYEQKVLDANESGDYFIYPWQVPLLRRATRIVDDPDQSPYRVLANGRGDAIDPRKGGRTDFEQKFYLGWSGIRVTDVIGQYDLKDLEFAKLGRFIKRADIPGLSSSDRQALLNEVYRSRRLLHRAGRKLLSPFLDAYAALSEEDLQALRRNTHFDGMERFLFKYSKLSQSDFDRAIREFGEDSIYVMRAMASTPVKWSGLRTQSDWRHIFNSTVNFSGGFESLMKDLYREMKVGGSSGGLSGAAKSRIASFAKNHGWAKGFLEWTAARVYASEHIAKRTEEEFQSQFVTEYLHAATNSGGKTGHSTTVSPSLLFKVVTWQDKVAMGPTKKEVEHFGSRQKAKEFFVQMAAKELAGTLKPEEAAVQFRVAQEEDGSDSSGTKFAKQSNSAVYFLRVPIDDVDVAFASLWRNQYEVYLKRGYGWARTNWQVIRDEVPANLLGVVNLGGLSPAARRVWDLMTASLNEASKKATESSAVESSDP